MRPQLFLGEKSVAAAGDAHDPHVGMAVVAVELAAELRPGRIDDPPGHDVDAMALRRHCQRSFFDINQLAAEVRMLGPVDVGGIEVALRIEKCDMHGDSALVMASA
ncbi:MAG: hypothetical protein R2844_11435 [Caldilineales bacterium]